MKTENQRKKEGENVEEKNLYCLSIHFKELAQAYINKKPVDITTPCKECKYNQNVI